ncbi:stage II sporulation protein R [Bacillus sp. ISL-75]|uniref:stage II sporulation protein R n=1 Tax=Bacillus sp. ISL-75 TaxID=2819137 RepID=UPI001BE997F3|nr:stage II sporulation protein R [Bacillus sp. ISL-75]MBT2726622.1 stage II sporulation protein R [Bacillus sp. ISL-75]
MKSKVIVWGYLIVLSLGTMLSLYMPKTEAASKESIVIPGEAIRLRILANSDFEEDQAIKRKVRDAVNAQITLWVQDLTSMEKARTVIKSKLPEIQAISEQVVRDQGSDQSVKVEFGKVQFPTKLYGQFLYPAGEYQAILITLGSGEGANWWCVLYPPLCFLDFSNGVAVSDGFEGEKKAKAKTVTPAKSEEKVEKAKTVATVEKVKEEASSVEDKKEVAAKVEKEVEVKVKVEKEEKAATVDEEEMKKPERLIEKDAPVFNEIMVEVDDEPVKLAKKDAPVYTAEDEKPVEVKFFVVEMWEKMFN